MTLKHRYLKLRLNIVGRRTLQFQLVSDATVGAGL